MKQKSALLFSFLFVSALILFSPSVLSGALLKNFPVKVKQPNGVELSLFASGDEFYNWLHDENGYTIIRDPQTGYYVYAAEKNGELISSGRIVSSDRSFNLAVLAALDIPKFLKHSPAKRIPPEELFPGGSPANPSQILAAPKTGTLNNIVIFIRFSDESEFTDAISIYDDMFNKSVADINSMYNYFKEASYNQLTVTSTFYPTPSSTVVSYQDAHPRAYYKPYDASTNPDGYQDSTQKREREHLLLKNAVDAVKTEVPSGLNVDGDGDGRVDNVCFIVYGSPGGWSDLLWPHMWSLSSQYAYINDKRVYTYNFQIQSFTKSSGVGVLCHEMFHSLGAPDLYHYSFDGMHPVYTWDLMENTSNPPRHMLAFMKFRYGTWISSIPEITLPGIYALNPLKSSSGNCYRIASPYSADEYFVVEYRKKIGVFENSLPGEGLLVYRINTNVDGLGNREGPPDEVYIYRPGGTPTADGTPSIAHFSSGAGRTAINDGTDPWCFLTEGTYGGLDISGISAVGDTISFTVGSVPASTYLLKVSATNPGTTVSVSPSDFYGKDEGSTSFSRLYAAATAVTLTAPSPVNSMSFIKWLLDGNHYSLKPTIQLTMNADHAVHAVYGLDLGEAVDYPESVWTIGGKGWFGQSDVYYYDNDAAQSSDIKNMEETSLETTIKGPGELSFYWKVSSEEDFDYLIFTINDSFVDRISGNVNWQNKTHSFGSGVYTVKWTYWKDEYVSEGSDCGWLDKVTFTGEPVANQDPLGTWDGQGVYYQNSFTGKWVKLATPADVIAVGDLGGDGIDDLIGTWPTQAGVWVRSSSSGSWTRYSSTTAKHIASGDMNGDGRDDLLATWDGSGVFYRNSVSGAWVKMAQPANLIASGDLDGDNTDDLIIVFPTPAGVWMKSSKTGTWSKISSTSARDIGSGDMNGDGRDDLLATWDGVGVFYRNSVSGAWTKMAQPADQVACGDIDGDGIEDLIAVWTSPAAMYVKYSKTGKWSKLSSPPGDTAVGRMKEAIWGGSPSGFTALDRPVGGKAEDPAFLSGFEDLSDEGPGGQRFSAQRQKNLSPGETGQTLAVPGPGDPGFAWVEQENLAPREEPAQKNIKKSALLKPKKK